MPEETTSRKFGEHVEWPRVIRTLVVLLWFGGLIFYSLRTQNQPGLPSAPPKKVSQNEPCSDHDCLVEAHAEILTSIPGDKDHLIWACIKNAIIPKKKSPNDWAGRFDSGLAPDVEFDKYATDAQIKSPLRDFIVSKINDDAPVYCLLWLLALLVYLMSAILYLPCWERLPTVVTVCIYAVIIAHIGFTFAQGGLVVSPIGYVFGTILVFLFANVKSATSGRITWKNKSELNTYRSLKKHEQLNLLMPLVLLVGSVAAHYAARYYYDEGSLFLLNQFFAYKSMYMLLTGIAVVLGTVSVFTRGADKSKPVPTGQ